MEYDIFHNRDHSHHFKASNMWDNSVKLITKGPYSLELQNSGWRNKKKKKGRQKSVNINTNIKREQMSRITDV